MIFDFSWINDPSAWIGLGTLIVIEIVLGIDNLVFISILAARLPEGQKQKAFSLGLSLALLMRLILLCGIAWIVSLTQPLLTIFEHTFSARDLILLVGGAFLLLKGTIELHERLEGHGNYANNNKHKVVFWHVVAQILVLDAVFSLDSVITSVGMVKHLPVMMLAVIVAMLVMLLAARPLTNFVERHPTIIVLCLGFLLMIGLSLILDGFGFDVPKGYLYAAIGFSVLVEAFNTVAVRNRQAKITPKNLRESTAKAVLTLLGGHEGSGAMEVAALAAQRSNGQIFAPKERAILARVIRLGGRTVRFVMTPRRRMLLLSSDATWENIAQIASACRHSAIAVCQHNTDEISGVVYLGELLARRNSTHNGKAQSTPPLKELIRKVPVVSEHMSLPNLLETLHSNPVPLILVQDEYGSIVGMVDSTDIVHALAGQMGESALEPALLRQPDGSWHLPGRLSIDEAQHLLGLNADTSAATLAGLILNMRGHIPVENEEWQHSGLQWKILKMDKKRIESIRVMPL